ncbi:MAG: hypothetical protein ACPG47_12000 [Leucothrix sp.]
MEKLVHPEDKVCQLKQRINWSFLDNKLGYLFKTEHAPPSRLIFGLLYLQSIDNLPYSDVISIWKKSPEWQYFCGEEFLTETFPLHDAALSIWSRVVGDQGRELMMQALGTVQRREAVATVH